MLLTLGTSSIHNNFNQQFFLQDEGALWILGPVHTRDLSAPQAEGLSQGSSALFSPQPTPFTEASPLHHTHHQDLGKLSTLSL